jgi:diadenylate cyclase
MARILELAQGIRPQDLVDIALLAAVIYWLLVLIKGTRTIPILLGLTVLVATYLLAYLLDLNAIGFLMEHLFSSAVVILVVLFQGDIRNALAQLGMTTMFTELSPASRRDLIEELSEAAFQLSRRKLGATIVLEYETGLRNYIERGKAVNAPPSVELLESIFHTSSPLHDGAVIVTREGELAAARCILPLASQPPGQPFVGTRHRSALGLTEETDALIIVVSEESGAVSLAYKGELYRNLNEDELRRRITTLLMGEHEADGIAGDPAQSQPLQG